MRTFDHISFFNETLDHISLACFDFLLGLYFLVFLFVLAWQRPIALAISVGFNRLRIISSPLLQPGGFLCYIPGWLSRMGAYGNQRPIDVTVLPDAARIFVFSVSSNGPAACV